MVKEEHPEKNRLAAAAALGLRVPGLALAAARAEGPVFTHAEGVDDLETGSPVRAATTRFRVASISKPITATALARMVAAGQIALGDPLQHYVPEFPHTGITIRQLAAHTAGIRGYRGKEYALNRPMGIAEALEVFQDDPLLFPPGEGYHYNSFDFVLLSLAMQRAYGQPFGDLVRREVLEPFGMRHTTEEIPGAPRPGQASFYTRTRNGFRPAVPVDNRYKLAGGGYLSTVLDICRLGRAYLQGHVAPGSILEPFLTSQLVGGKPTYYGLGWEVSRDPRGDRFYGHTGNSVGAYSIFRVYPDLGLTAVVLINSSVPALKDEIEAVLQALKQRFS